MPKESAYFPASVVTDTELPPQVDDSSLAEAVDVNLPYNEIEAIEYWLNPTALTTGYVIGKGSAGLVTSGALTTPGALTIGSNAALTMGNNYINIADSYGLAFAHNTYIFGISSGLRFDTNGSSGVLTLSSTGTAAFSGTVSVTTGLIAASSTMALFNTVATTINFGAAASTAINMGHASGTNTILGATNFSQNVTVSGTVGIGSTTANRQVSIYHATLPITQWVNSTSGQASGDGTIAYLTSTSFIIDNQDGDDILIGSGGVNLTLTGITAATFAGTLAVTGSTMLGGTAAPSTSGLTTLKVPMARVRKNSDFSHNSSGNFLAITFPASDQTTTYDTDSMFTTAANTRITIKTAGKYLIVGQVLIATSGTGQRQVKITKNGAVDLASVGAAGNASFTQRMEVVAVWTFAANDYVELYVYQDSGGTLVIPSASDFAPVLSATYLGT